MEEADRKSRLSEAHGRASVRAEGVGDTSISIAMRGRPQAEGKGGWGGRDHESITTSNQSHTLEVSTNRPEKPSPSSLSLGGSGLGRNRPTLYPPRVPSLNSSENGKWARVPSKSNPALAYVASIQSCCAPRTPSRYIFASIIHTRHAGSVLACMQSPISTEKPVAGSANSLHPDDLVDLQRSGLNDAMIAAMGCFSVESGQIHDLTGVKVTNPGYAISYHGLEDQTGMPYYRFRLRGASSGQRYVSGRGEDTQVYDPPGRVALEGSMLVITEGEKKAAKAVQEGIPCVAIQGVHSWCDAGARAAEKAVGTPVHERTAPIAELLRIANSYKKVLVLGDSDLLGNPQGRGGLEILAKSLAYRGVRCTVAYCPPATVYEEGEQRIKKQGLDDWLVHDRFAAIQSIPALFFTSDVNENEITDSDNAQTIADLFGAELVFSRGVWYRWDESIWRIDDAGARRTLGSKIGDHYRAQAERLGQLLWKVTKPYANREDAFPGVLKDWAMPVKLAIKRAYSAAGKIENLRQMDAAFAIGQGHLSVPSDVWDRDVHLLAVPNGVVDLRTGELQHSAPELRMTRLAGTFYDPQAQAPLFKAFLSEMQPDPAMRDYLQRLMGYAATGHAREQKLFSFVGGGANGKGTLMGLVMSALGDYAVKAPASLLAEQPPDKPRNDLAALAGARLVSISETSGNLRVDMAFIKSITGQDLVSARFLNREYFQFLPCFTPIIDTNYALTVRDQGEGAWRRFEIVPWDVTIARSQQDRKLRERLLEELPGILKWIIDGAKRYHESGLTNVPRIADETQALRESCDLVGRWLDACVIKDSGARVSSTDLYANFSHWVTSQGETNLISNKAFAQGLKRKEFENRKSNGVMVWVGIRVRRERPTAAYHTADANSKEDAIPASVPSVVDSSQTLRPTPIDRRMTAGGNRIL